MRIVFPLHTFRRKAGEGKFTMIPPGTPVTVSDENARDAIERGLAEPYAASAPVDEVADAVPVESTDPPNDASGGAEGTSEQTADGEVDQTADPEDLEEIQAAILELMGDESAFNPDGTPKVSAVSEKLGRKVSAAERDAAFEALEAGGD